jgi:hypothetical protein
VVGATFSEIYVVPSPTTTPTITQTPTPTITSTPNLTLTPTTTVTPTGTLIPSGFGGATRYNNTVEDTIIHSNGDIMSVGTFSLYNSTSQLQISGLNSYGEIDSSFNIGGGIYNGIPYTIEQQKIDNKLVVAGSFTTYNLDATKKGIIRLNLDGSVDSSFNNAPDFESFGPPGPTWYPGSVLAIKTQLDGKVVLGGTFTRLNGTLTYNRIVRLNSDGSIDNGFTIGSGFNNNIYQHGIQLQSDNKLIINDRINMLCNEINLMADDYEADYGIRILSAERSESGKLKFKIKNHGK